MTSQERTNVDKMEAALRAVMTQDDHQAIRGAIDALNQGTMRLAELMMDSAVGAALKGKTMDNADVGEGPEAPHPIAQAEIKRRSAEAVRGAFRLRMRSSSYAESDPVPLLGMTNLRWAGRAKAAPRFSREYQGSGQVLRNNRCVKHRSEG